MELPSSFCSRVDWKEMGVVEKEGFSSSSLSSSKSSFRCSRYVSSCSVLAELLEVVLAELLEVLLVVLLVVVLVVVLVVPLEPLSLVKSSNKLSKSKVALLALMDSELDREEEEEDEAEDACLTKSHMVFF